MKSTFLLFVTIFLFSCNQKTVNKNNNTQAPDKQDTTFIETATEEFEVLPTDNINQVLINTNENLSAQDIMKLYYPLEEETDEGNEKIEIFETALENGNTEVTLIHDNFMDDSQRGVKYVMVLKEVDDKWTVVSVKKNWKCWEGRGNTDWGIELCL